ncbi:MAG TPA: AMP-binding protein [Steroidobacter sp.]|uniref:AMP-binding protein n=1 Tax=Steroidobacter sp. TaxID=1978227 RepID=UPI002ED7C21C
MSTDRYTSGRRLTQLASERPHQPAVIVARNGGCSDTLTMRELDEWSSRLAHRLADAGVRQHSFVAIHLPTCVEHVVATYAAHKLGACPTPLSAKLPAVERDGLLALAQPAAIVSDAPDLRGLSRDSLHRLDGYPATAPPDRIPEPHKAIASGGSTGRPKLIVSPDAFAYPIGGNPHAKLFGIGDGDLLYAPGPLYHNQPFSSVLLTLFAGGTILLNEKFDAAVALDLIERHRPRTISLVPTMMQRMLRVEGIERRDLSSIRMLWHMASACPAWVKRGWIDLIGAEKVWEAWASTEMTGITIIRGDEWLRKPGSVGKGFDTELRIVGEDGGQLPPGVVGEIYSRMSGAPARCRYVGSAPLRSLPGGFSSVGDLGYVDEDGYLFLSDRRVDLIVSGGANVYPAEVEAVLTQHPGVRDAVVIGLTDDDLGQRVHAIIEPHASCPTAEELDARLRQHLAGYKVPRSYEFVETLPRDESGKIRRSALREQKTGQSLEKK